MINKVKVLFICKHNSARSQMAEGYLNAKYGNQYEAMSAGTEITSVHPKAIEVMKEIGIDISRHYSKEMFEFFDKEIDIVVTVCDGESGVCPMFPGAKRSIHHEFTDPVSTSGTGEEISVLFRKVRDDIIEWIDEHVKEGGVLHPI